MCQNVRSWNWGGVTESGCDFMYAGCGVMGSGGAVIEGGVPCHRVGLLTIVMCLGKFQSGLAFSSLYIPN